MPRCGRACLGRICNPAKDRTYRDVGALPGEDLAERTGGRRRNLQRHLVGFKLGDRLIGGNRIARPFQPFRYRRLGN